MRRLERFRDSTFGRGLRGTAAVAATYVYFLLFAQFGFLHLLESKGLAAHLRPVMAGMGIAGLAASLAAGALLRGQGGRRLLRLGFAGCAGSALAAIAASGPAQLIVAAVAVGAFTALVTVCLAARLRDFLPGPNYGLAVGLGTGCAYLICNLPALFEGSAETQAVAAAIAALLGLAAIGGDATVPAAPSTGPAVETPALGPADYRFPGFASIVASFLALVWLDSAAFAVIQETIGLKGQTWAGGGQLWVLGFVHLLGALAAGLAIDRGRFRGLLTLAFALFAVAFTLLQSSGSQSVAGPLYAFGISLYSVSLVAYPSYGSEGPGQVPRRWRSAWLFAIAGWLGSALGVGMARDLHSIPPLFLCAAGTLLLSGWSWPHRDRFLALLRVHASSLAVLVLAGLGMLALKPASGEALATEEVTRGREVYIAEGCIHCHSQFVRPAGADADLFGPAGPLDRDQRPPLPGNRRQGPDLANLGLRRSPAWNRLHLIDPRAVSPGSLMPSYAHLFAPGHREGEALVAYLAGLGAGGEQLRRRAIETYRFAADPASGSARRGRQTFGLWCSPCHGAEGRGDGPYAEVFGSKPAMNLAKGSFWSVSWGPGSESLPEGLARVVKFGLPGTSMPGHESLPDEQVADLVACVLELAGEPGAPAPAGAGSP